MGFFSKLFGGEEKPQPKPLDLKPVSEVIDEDRYWQIIHDTKARSGGDQGRQEDLLVEALEKLPLQDIVGFRLRTDKLLYDTYDQHLWCAGYIMNGGLSDDGFEYFRLWLIGQGREIFDRAKANPDSLADLDEDDIMGQEFWFEPLWYVALTAFENKTGKRLYDFIDNDNFEFREGNYPQFEFTWQEDNPESLRTLCPNLMAKYGEP